MRVVVFVDLFPELSETFVVNEARALRELGHDVRVEAGRPADNPNPDAKDIEADHMSKDGRVHSLIVLARLTLRHPLRATQDLASRRRWKHDERPRPLRQLAPAIHRAKGADHLHAHFAAGAALDAMRAAAFLDLPYSVTAHAYDIYAEPANLREKLERAAFATSGCDYTVNDLRAIAPQATVHKIVMGVDGDRFKRTKPYPGGRTVVAVGRLVEKKGFEHLIDAVGILEEQGRPVERVVIAGDGPLHATLGARARDRGVAKRVTLAGARTPAEIRQLLEEADLLAMPSVIAENGDRDSMPVAVKEALAMEVPVVASDEVGLPEIVKPPWGRLAPPGDAAALADAIDGQLGLPDEDRRAGRAFVLEHASVMRETERLAMILDEARGLHPQTESERR